MEAIIDPTLELATLVDAAEIATVYLASWDDALPDIRRIHGPDATVLWIRTVMLARGQTRVARRNGGILGFLNLVGDEIEQLYLKPGHCRRGIGSRLLNQAKAMSPDRLRLYTFQRNAAARAFYEAHGFVALEWSDGSRNEEGEPDIRYEWTGAA